jgi:hypothetical protein
MSQKNLQEYDEQYDGGCHMVWSTVPEGHYHCGLSVGSRAHHTRESLIYAIELLATGLPDRQKRAAGIVAQVLSLQDPDPTSKTYGIWPVYLEEPLGALAVPDWNYADFIGSQLVYILNTYKGALPGELARKVAVALGHAAWSIFRRNVGPHYTNISLSGAGVTAVVGERLQERRLVDYAHRRLENLIAHYRYHAGFNEYNSPSYAMAGLHWCEWMRQYVNDRSVVRSADILRYLTWRDFGEHFHPTTGQLAGPQSRAYTDWLDGQIVAYIRQQTGVAVPWRGSAEQLAAYQYNPQPPFFEYVKPRPCPADLVERFGRLPEAPRELRHRYIRREPEETSVVGTTWFTDDACLGSINRDNLWTQRRPLLAYWRTPSDPAACLRLRFLKDGRDFASAYVSNVQSEYRILSAFSLLTHKGDWHDHIDRPAEDGVFVAEDLRVRYALTGVGVRCAGLGVGRVELRAGDLRAVIHTTGGRFGPFAVEWELGQDDDGDQSCVFLDGICYRGRQREFRLDELGDIVVAAGVELLAAGQEPSTARILTAAQGRDRLSVTWPAAQELVLSAPLSAGPHPCSI